MADLPRWLQRLFDGRFFIFYGKTKKISYSGNLEGEPVLPVQGVTALFYTGCGLCGIYLYLNSMFTAAFLTSMLTTQGWRVLSETLRADYRGAGKISAYQFMGLIGTVYGCGVIAMVPALTSTAPDVMKGISVVWHPAALLFIQIIWLAIFLYTGRSTVTGSTLSFHVFQDKI